MNKIYAGIGSRKTPEFILKAMTEIGYQLAAQGWLLRSGNARGADQAFAKMAIKKEIHLPWDGYNYGRTENPSFLVPSPTPEMIEIAARHHPMWDVKRRDGTSILTDDMKMFMIRNVTIIRGQDLNTPAAMVICWTPAAAVTGGTGHALKVAQEVDIPIFNLANPFDWDRLEKFTEQFDEPVQA